MRLPISRSSAAAFEGSGQGFLTVTTLKGLGVLIALAMASCGGESKCEKFCDSVRNQLIQNFGVRPTQIDCSDQQWDTDDCQQCIDTLQTDFGVDPTTGLQQCESE
jgi:hypothetical protein